MSLSDLDVRAQYNGNGSNTTFAIPFAEIDGFETETKVYVDDTLQTLTTHYTIVGTNVEFVSAPASGTNNVTVIRQLSLTQPTDLLPSGAVDLEAIEAALDRVAALVQQVEEKTDRAPLLKITSSYGSLTLPEPVADNIISWNTGATDLENKTAAEVLALTGALVAANNLSDLTDAAAAIANLGITATATELNYMDGVTSNVQTQLDGKEPTVSLTANRALQSAAGGGLEASSVTDTELGYVSGVTSAIQTQLDAKAPIASPSFTTNADLENQGEFRFYEQTGNGTNYVGFEAPDAVTTNTIWKLPDGDGSSGQILSTDGSGNLSWAADAGSGSLGVTTKTTTYTALTSDDIILADTSGGAWTLTLYTAVSNTGNKLTIKKTTSDTNALTIDGNASETIEGKTSVFIDGQYDTLELISDGSNWVLSSFSFNGNYKATSSTLTPTGSGQYHQMTSNSLSLIPGKWEVKGFMQAGASSTPNYSYVFAGWYESNGANSGTSPTNLGTNFTSVGMPRHFSSTQLDSGSTYYVHEINMPSITVTNTSTSSLYLVPFTNQTTSANSRITAYISAKRVGL